MPSLTKVQSGFMEAQGALPLSSGTAAAPGLKFDDHSGTGMFSPSTGVIGFSTSSKQNALTMHTDGSVVINGTTSNVVGRLTVAGDGKDIVFGRTESTGTGGTGRLVATGNLVYVQAGANASSGSSADLIFCNYGGVGERLRITTTGELVSSNGTLRRNVETSSFALSGGTASNSGANIVVYGNNHSSEANVIRFRVGGSEKARITSAGLVGINDTSPDATLSVGGSTAFIDVGAAGGNRGKIGYSSNDLYFGTSSSSGEFIFKNNVTSTDNPASSGTEKLSIRSNGDLILGPYDAPGSYTTVANNVPYSIKVAPHGWQHHSEIAAISMGNHSGSTGNDDGEIVFKTAKDAHSSTTGLVERLRITSDGKLGLGEIAPDFKFHSKETGGSSIAGLFETNQTDAYISFQASGTTASSTVRIGAVGDNFQAFINGLERLRIDNVGSAQFTGQDSPSGRNTRISRYGSLLVATTGELISNARCSIDSGNGNIISEGSIQATGVNLQSSSTSSWFQTGTSLYSTNYVWAAKNSSSNTWHSGLQTDGDLLLGNVLNDARIGIYGSSGNMGLKNATTSAKLNVQTDIGGNYTGWKERNVAAGSMSQASIDSKTPTINDFTYPNNSNGMLIWSTSKIGFAAGGESPQYGTGVQMVFDSGALMLGGIRAFDRTASSSTTTNWNIRLKTNGLGQFKSALYANPLTLTSSDSYIKSAYGAISNSTVSSLNNLLIAQNIRGYVSGLDGGSANNNFYSVVTYGAGSMGHAGTEYCFGGTTKFYNDTAASTANTAFTPAVSMQINGNGHVTKPKNPSFAVTWTGTNTSVSANSQLQFDSVIHNIGSHYSTSTYRFTAPISGTYQINFWSIYYLQSVSNAAVFLYKNNARIYGGDVHFSEDFSNARWSNVSYSMALYLTSGDYLHLMNGSTAVTYHGRHWSRWSGYLVG